MNRKSVFASLAVVVSLVGPASAIELRLQGNVENGLDLGLSQTGAFKIGVLIGSDDGDIGFANLFFDGTPLGERRGDGYDVVGANFLMTRNDGTRWNGRAEQDYPVDIEGFAGLYGDSVGTRGDDRQRYFEEVTLLGTSPGNFDLYFENQQTAEGAPRPPALFSPDFVQKGYADNMDLPGFVHFANAWIDPNRDFDVPFLVTVTPDPGSLVLLGLGAVTAFRRRRLKNSDFLSRR